MREQTESRWGLQEHESGTPSPRRVPLGWSYLWNGQPWPPVAPAVDVGRQVPDHQLRDHKEIWRPHAAAVHPDDVWVAEARHDLQLMLRGGSAMRRRRGV